MSDWTCPILTYHAQNVFGNDYGENDHVALRVDLQLIQEAGFRVLPLQRLVDTLLGRTASQALSRAICITFDDGCLAEVDDLHFAEHGEQPSFERCLREFRQQFASEQVETSATTFVIADEVTREAIDRQALAGQGWMTDAWWAQAQSRGVINIQNHGWDHKHPTADDGIDPTLHERFKSVTTFTECERQVVTSGEKISGKAKRSFPNLFAYPYGQPSDYIIEQYFPQRAIDIGLEAAFTTSPQHVTGTSDRWRLPRYVCGRDWRSPERFQTILQNRWQPHG